jgi:YHS domain-containing protein
MERDPVCGVFIDPARAQRLNYHGKAYYFCSHTCKSEFEDRPDEYAARPPATILQGVIDDPIRILATAVQEGKGPIGH